MTTGDATTSFATGGCQCGAVRYRVRTPIAECNLCHCRMCQKASGGPFMVFIAVPAETVTFTRGAPATFASSSIATRGFCRDCGTPLTYQYKPERLSLSHGSLDEPSIIAPTERVGSESVLPWCEHVGTLPIESVDDWLAALARPVETFQHPDRDV